MSRGEIPIKKAQSLLNSEPYEWFAADISYS